VTRPPLGKNTGMSAFKTGSLASPVRLIKTTPRVVLDAQLAWQGPFEHVYAKVMPVIERSIEAVCTWIALEVELPVPEPRFLRMPRSRMPKGHPWPFAEQPEEFVFATVAIESAQQLLRLEDDVTARLLDKWPLLAAAAAFDQLIANDDRTKGNILLGPRQDLWLIDHARALGGAGNRLFSSEVEPLVSNLFLRRIAGYPLVERQRLRPALLSSCLRLSAAVLRIPYDKLRVSEETAIQIDSYLRQRAGRLQAMVLNEIGLPDLYDSGEAQRLEH
jgi:hypothetical protein